MPACPICRTEATAMLQATPYRLCQACGTAFQSPGPRAWRSSLETDRGFPTAPMSADREVNRQLAQWLLANALGGKPGRVLDVGCGEPVLPQSLAGLGCEAIGLDVDPRATTHGSAVGIPIVIGDVLLLERGQILGIGVGGRFRLVTLVHMFDRFADPVAALRKLRELVTDDGRVFLRLPDHAVAGSDRYMQRAHLEVAPLMHTLPGLLELCVQAADQFSVELTYTLDGAGQRDVLLRALTRKPSVLAGMIVKNEERDLPRCLKSIEDVVDGVVLVDTGSTDRTLEVATTTIGKPVQVQTYTGASRQDEHGDWKLWDFGKARNVFVDEIDRRGADWSLWMDADDELVTPQNLRRAVYWDQHDVFGVQIESAGSRWTHHRLWKAGRGIRFEGRCHEYPTIGGHAALTLVDSVIRHDATPGAGESANQRNLRILSEEFAESSSPRTAFYLGSTHKDAGRWRDAVEWYAKRIAMGEGYRDEWLFAALYKARCERAMGDAAAAECTLLEAAGRERGWAEFWMELAYLAYGQRRYTHALGFALQAADAPVPPTQLWRETDKYTDQPARLVSWCHEHLGDTRAALAWAMRARERIGASDAEWDQRIARLESTLVSVRTAAPRIALHRPGAIGDILMTLNLVPWLRAAHPGHSIHYACEPGIGAGLAELMRAAGVDSVVDCAGFAPRPGEYARTFNLVGYPLAEGYPERPMRKHLLDYFAAELGLALPEWPALRLARPSRPAGLPGRYATLQVRSGWSAYKNWPIERWAAVVLARADIPVVQIGTAGEPRIDGVRHDFLGTPLPTAIALVANATLHLGIDSFANHLTNYGWIDEGGAVRRVPAVILWGSTQASAAGYPHNDNVSLDLHCQPCFREDPAVSRSPRGPCINPSGQVYAEPRHACMFGISVERVLETVGRAWQSATG